MSWDPIARSTEYECIALGLLRRYPVQHEASTEEGIGAHSQAHARRALHSCRVESVGIGWGLPAGELATKLLWERLCAFSHCFQVAVDITQRAEKCRDDHIAMARVPLELQVTIARIARLLRDAAA